MKVLNVIMRSKMLSSLLSKSKFSLKQLFWFLYRLVAFDAPLNFENADVGRCVETDYFDFANDEGVENLVLSTPAVPSFTVVVTQSPPLRSKTTTSPRRRPPSTTPVRK
jgi:hypothetical protein